MSYATTAICYGALACYYGHYCAYTARGSAEEVAELKSTSKWAYRVGVGLIATGMFASLVPAINRIALKAFSSGLTVV